MNRKAKQRGYQEPTQRATNAVVVDRGYPEASRRHQMYPRLTAAQVARIMDFGTPGRWHAGQLMFETGKPGPGMYVLVRGSARLTRRDGLGRSETVVVLSGGQFLGETAQLSGKPALVDGFAETELETILVTPERLRMLLISEAELGEVIMRALILRRVALVERGSGPVLIGRSDDTKLVTLEGLLFRLGHPHSVLNPETDLDAKAFLQGITWNEKYLDDRDFPLVIFPDGTVLECPTERQLVTKLGLVPSIAADKVFDVGIVGAGPGGLAAAVYGASEGLSVAVFDVSGPGGQAGASARIENYLGFPTGISGQALAGRAFVQALKFGATISIPTKVQALHCGGPVLKLELEDGQFVSTRTVIVASGAAYKRPKIQGLADNPVRGVYYWATPIEAGLCAGSAVALLGGGNSAGQAAVYLSRRASSVIMFVRGESLEKSMSRYLIDRITSIPNIELRTLTTVVSASFDEGGLTALTAENAGTLTSLAIRHLFLFTGANPNTSWLKSCAIDLDDKGFVLTGLNVLHRMDNIDGNLRTSLSNVFAIGDVRSSSTKRVAAAVGEGAAVISEVHAALKRQSIIPFDILPPDIVTN